MEIKQDEFKKIKVTEANFVIYVKLNRPDVRNAFDSEMISELRQAFERLDSRDDIRAIVLSGEGRSFCAGADLHWMKSQINYTFEQNLADSNNLLKMFESILNCQHPVIGIAHGGCFGGALGLIAACDLVLVEENSQFCFSEVKLGLAPAVIGPFVLKKAVFGILKPLMMFAQVFNVETAQRAGLVHGVFSENTRELEMKKWLAQISDCGPRAVRETKKLLHSLTGTGTNTSSGAGSGPHDVAGIVSGKVDEVAWRTWSVQGKKTTELISKLRVSQEGQEGLRAFLEKRKPSWSQQ